MPEVVKEQKYCYNYTIAFRYGSKYKEKQLMNNVIIYEPASKLREIAREALRGKWAAMFAGMLIYYLFSTVMENVLDYFFSIVRYIPLVEGYGYYFQINYASMLYQILVYGPLSYGLAMFLMTCFREKNVNYGLTLEGFGVFWKTLVLYLLYTIKVWLWSLLFVVPGIIATFRYAQCFYLQVDHPDWGASQCIRESSRLMRGNKWKLFCVQLSFIGWMILASIPVTIVDSLEIYNFTYVILSIIVGLPGLLVMMYEEMTCVGFYEILTGNLVVVRTEETRYERPLR